jgi:hypothetical protein
MYDNGKVDGFKTDNYYWSSTTVVSSTAYAWSVYFAGGGVSYYGKTGSFCVRPVLGGQCVGSLKIKKSRRGK